MEHVVWLGARGINLEVRDGQILATPRTRISDEIRAYIREHRDVILATLLDPDPWSARRESYGAAYRSESDEVGYETLEVA